MKRSCFALTTMAVAMLIMAAGESPAQPSQLFDWSGNPTASNMSAAELDEMVATLEGGRSLIEHWARSWPEQLERAGQTVPVTDGLRVRQFDLAYARELIAFGQVVSVMSAAGLDPSHAVINLFGPGSDEAVFFILGYQGQGRSADELLNQYRRSQGNPAVEQIRANIARAEAALIVANGWLTYLHNQQAVLAGTASSASVPAQVATTATTALPSVPPLDHRPAPSAPGTPTNAPYYVDKDGQIHLYGSLACTWTVDLMITGATEEPSTLFTDGWNEAIVEANQLEGVHVQVSKDGFVARYEGEQAMEILIKKGYFEPHPASVPGKPPTAWSGTLAYQSFVSYGGDSPKAPKTCTDDKQPPAGGVIRVVVLHANVTAFYNTYGQVSGTWRITNTTGGPVTLTRGTVRAWWPSTRQWSDDPTTTGFTIPETGRTKEFHTWFPCTSGSSCTGTHRQTWEAVNAQGQPLKVILEVTGSDIR